MSYARVPMYCNQLQNMKSKKDLSSEASAFTKRINLRSKKGFVPDLQNLKVCNFFYKSFWRHPNFAKLFVGEISKYYISFFKKNLRKNAKILDLGCGPGYFSLELARAGFEVVGIDVSQGAINSANETLLNSKKKKSLKLSYLCTSIEKLNYKAHFDGVLSSGFLHHIKDLKKASSQIRKFLKKNGVLLLYEPQHQEWKKFDALLVLFLRHIFKSLNMWYDKKLKIPFNVKIFEKQLKEVYNEFFYERDQNEKAGQSPNDLSSDKNKIIKALIKNFKFVDSKPAFSFIYRLIGGLRGNQYQLNKISKLIADLEKYGLETGVLNANYFYANFTKR